MNGPLFDRRRLRLRPLAERRNKLEFPRDAVFPDRRPGPLSAASAALLGEAARRIRAARAAGRPVICAFGAHTIKNGLGPVLINLLEGGWLTHLATNGAGIIHDWEIAFQGRTSEDVRENVGRGEFGTWDETGRYIGLGLLVGAHDGLGYGESIGRLIEQQGLVVPAQDELAGSRCPVRRAARQGARRR